MFIIQYKENFILENPSPAVGAFVIKKELLTLKETLFIEKHLIFRRFQEVHFLLLPHVAHIFQRLFLK